jgi:hypothetical protein
VALTAFAIRRRDGTRLLLLSNALVFLQPAFRGNENEVSKEEREGDRPREGYRPEASERSERRTARDPKAARTWLFDCLAIVVERGRNHER